MGSGSKGKRLVLFIYRIKNNNLEYLYSENKDYFSYKNFGLRYLVNCLILRKYSEPMRLS